nr:hypothetical protein [Mucilaginibacter sp. L294]
MQKQLYHIMEHEPGKGKISSASYFGVLYQMVVLLLSKSKENTLFGLIRDVYHTHQVPLLNRHEFRQDVHELPIKQRAGVFYMAHWLLEQWPNRFINLCQDHRLHSEEILRYFKNAPEWFWQPVFDELDRNKYRVPEVYHEEKELDRSVLRIRDERLNRFLYDYDADDSFYSIDMDGFQLPEVDPYHATYRCRKAGVLYSQMRDMEGWYQH